MTDVPDGPKDLRAPVCPVCGSAGRWVPWNAKTERSAPDELTRVGWLAVCSSDPEHRGRPSRNVIEDDPDPA
jgi:hypothetical protein